MSRKTQQRAHYETVIYVIFWLPIVVLPYPPYYLILNFKYESVVTLVCDRLNVSIV
jgi:hypothetical protein